MNRLIRIGDSGAVAIWVAGTLTVFIGVIGLSMDLGRTATADTELKWASDAAALAGARQLDGFTGARNRATLAATGAASGTGVGLTSNSDTFSSNAAPVQVVNVKYLSKLGAGDGTAGDVEATNDANAHFIQVIVEQKAVNNLFIEVVGGAATSTVQESSVAGYGAAVCQVSPLMVCNPNEDKGTSFDPQPGQQVWVKMRSAGGGNAAWKPGDFGLLDLPNGQQGAKAIGDAFAQKNGANTCYGSRVSTAPGQKTSASDGINTRLDIYVQSAKSYANDANAYPAYNVTKGLVGQCGKTPSQGSLDTYTGPSDSNQAIAGLVQYPRDNCIYAGNCTLGTRFGDGSWNRALYWATNHPGTAPAVRPAGWNSWTRYATYRWEVDNDIPPAIKTIPNNSATGAENGIPRCFKATNSLPGGKIPKGVDARTPGLANWSKDPDRRVLMTAVVNCKAEGIHGNASGVQVQKWMLMFLTEAVGYYVGGDDNDLLMEVIRTIDLGRDKAIAHEIVQLYR